jgi:Carboxypeptidase regulatory-like domain/TonB-dependent Receptor Plug Domain
MITRVRTIKTAAMLVVLAFVSLVPAKIRAQLSGAKLSGTITDTSGAVIANAKLSVKKTDTAEVSQFTTNKDGFYQSAVLPPGTYEMTVAAPGFPPEVRTGVVVTPGVDQVLNVNLAASPGTIAAPAVSLGSSTVSGGESSTTVRDMPLNGRSWTDLATLQPGVSSIRGIAAATTHDRLGRGLGNQMSVDGGRPQQNNYLLNGISVNDYSNQAPGSILGENLGADAVSEFTILTSNYSTEYGRSSGGVISAITRSGTNEFHGSAYEFLRNSAMDAANFFDNATGSPKPEFRRNIFGVSAGGPIQKEKTFIFGDYEELRGTTGLSTVDVVPSRAARGIAPGGTKPTQDAFVNGAFLPLVKGTGSANNPDPVTGIDKAVEPYLNAFYPRRAC